MSFDETFKSINRIWQEISVIVVVHAMAIGLGIYAQLIPARLITQGVRSLASLPELSAFRENLVRIGLDLPIVVGVAIIVYVVFFQRLSAAVISIPAFRLFYSQPALWRAGKCFDELKQLSQWFEGYTASAGLADLEVSLGLAITESAKEYEQHYEELVGGRVVSAALWARYYSGFCLLAFVSTGFIVAIDPMRRALLLPAGLLVAAFIARCGWEAQVEGAVLGRLRFAIDCGIVSGVKRREESASAGKLPDFEALSSRWNPTEERPEDKDRLTRVLALELKLASEFLMLPPPFLPYEHFWALHYVRGLWPLKGAGCLPLMQNSVFREWFVQSLWVSLGVSPERPREGESANPMRGDMRDITDRLSRALSRHAAKDAGTEEQLYRQHMDLIEGIDFPLWVPDDRLVARIFRKCFPLARWPFPRLFLVDEARRYPVSGINSRRPIPPEKQPLKEWAARKRVD